MKLYRTDDGVIAESNGRFHSLHDDWNALINHTDLLGHLRAATAGQGEATLRGGTLAPVTSQEVWAAGVTYLRSRSARIDESKDAGGGTFYDRVYNAERPELFFKSSAFRVRGDGEPIRVRGDARWSVPEPELALYINARGQIIGYTIANDVSSRDIEGENPLYLPQAKVYDGSCALGPAVLVTDAALPPETPIELRIMRDNSVAFEGSTTFSQLKRTPVELVGYLYRETSFPDGCVLLTGTGVIPPDQFTLQSGDDVEIRIPPIGALRNRVE
ncbi:MAG: fumarylacetoacetate hydrolase family protein [bacterium]